MIMQERIRIRNMVFPINFKITKYDWRIYAKKIEKKKLNLKYNIL